MTGAGCGLAKLSLPQHSTKYREKSGLAPRSKPEVPLLELLLQAQRLDRYEQSVTTRRRKLLRDLLV